VSGHDPRAVLRAAGLVPKRGFGQSFLIAPDVARRIAEAAIPGAERGEATVVEIGAGTGALTHELAARAKHVIAIERDRDLVPLLRETLPDHVEVVEADAKSFDYPRGIVLAGNLPYQITGPLLQRAVGHTGLVRAVFMVQAEVASRLLASPGTKEYGALTVFVRAAFDVARLMRVAAGSFYPQPDVTSAVVVLTPRGDRIEETSRFQALVHAAFEKRRKTLRNAWRGLAPDDLIAAAALTAGVSLDARGETLSVEQFALMSDRMDEHQTGQRGR
jgi:16S rRNA (adenine1518-N6/adenine1519-N6)-dimethyltransferase